MLKKDNELIKKEKENEINMLTKNNELLNKDLEIAELRNQILSSKTKKIKKKI